MVKTKVTLRDVARRVGVPESTVSRVLGEKTRHMVTPAVADRVVAAANDLGYRPNAIAYSLRTNRTFTVGVLIPDLRNPVFPPIIRGIEDVLGAADYTAILANTDNDAARERTIMSRMMARWVDGLIVATARRHDDQQLARIAEDIPTVLINRSVDGGAISYIANDDIAGIALTVSHLIGLGHTRIAHVAGPRELSTGHRRHEGFLAAMREGGLTADADLVAFADSFTEGAGRRAAEALLDGGADFSAIVAGNDLLAIGCFDALAARGLDCPGDVSVTGFNDMPFVDRLRPPLTTVHIPHYEMGAGAARILLEQIENPEAPPRTNLLECSLVVRDSTAAPVA